VTAPVRALPIRALDAAARRAALEREWLVTNGLGGYASGTIGGAPTRRYHGLLIAAFAAPLGRRLLVTDVVEHVTPPGGERVDLAGPEGGCLVDFRLEGGLPVWRYELDGLELEKRVVMPHQQNSVHVVYRTSGGGARPLALTLAVAVHHRSHDAPVDTPLPEPVVVTGDAGRYEIAFGELPPLKLAVRPAARFVAEPRAFAERSYHVEIERGYEQRAAAWSPGEFAVEIADGEPLALVASTEPWDVALALAPPGALEAERERRAHLVAAAAPAARAGLGAELVLAADQFVVKPVGRSAETARLRAEGGESRSVIAGFHWFTDWGRDTMISLEGLTLLTGRAAEAGLILRTFAHSIRDGLLPNLFPEGENEGLYHTADATLWFFHALERYVAASGDRELLAALLPRLVEVAERHVAGTRFGIGVDPADGLLREGAPGYQLTWMDAKVDGWVVTPRRGKPVEINALWYNALCVLAGWLRDAGRGAEAAAFAAHAARARAAFNRRFWIEDRRQLFDVVDGEDGDDASCRPNQVFAISLPHPVLARERWAPVLATVRAKLVTPFGLRTLSADHPAYCGRYEGDLRRRDAAYHQGTVWPWLIGPFIDAWLRVHPGDRAAARGFLAAFDGQLGTFGVGSISEICDAEPPYTPRGCISQAWSVAEVLRAWVKTRPQ
jgi:predicted glycogen debranching enzyme